LYLDSILEFIIYIKEKHLEENLNSMEDITKQQNDTLKN